MTNAKIEFAFGSLSFSGEGEETWLSKQLDKVITAAPGLSELRAPKGEDAGAGGGAATPANGSSKFTGALANHIKEKGGEKKQVARFLAAADWLRLRGATTLTTGAVSKALSDHHQKALSNPADCLGQNISKGFCEKSGNGFFITPDGLKELGHAS